MKPITADLLAGYAQRISGLVKRKVVKYRVLKLTHFFPRFARSDVSQSVALVVP